MEWMNHNTISPMTREPLERALGPQHPDPPAGQRGARPPRTAHAAHAGRAGRRHQDPVGLPRPPRPAGTSLLAPFKVLSDTLSFVLVRRAEQNLSLLQITDYPFF